MIFRRSASLAVAVAIIAAAGLAPSSSHAAPSSSQAAPPREALVIGNGTYDALPGVPACLLSAHAVSAALRGAGFQVVEREDATSGGIDAAIGEMSRSLTAAPGATAFVYVCAYATALNGRTFLLPTSANITRPTDVLTQGVLARSLLEMLTRGGAGAAVVALDVVPAPGAPAALGFDAALQGDLPAGLGSIAVSQAKPADAPTLLGGSLAGDLKASTVQIAPLLSALQGQLSANPAVTVAAIHVPATQAYLVGEPAPAPSASAHAAPPPAQPVPPPAQAAALPAPPAAVAALPDEAQMTDADRRRVQTALARLGYYDGQVDGVFGPDTRAAIRRYQHELHAAMTGQLTAEQANRLAGGT